MAKHEDEQFVKDMSELVMNLHELCGRYDLDETALGKRLRQDADDLYEMISLRSRKR